MKNDLAEVPQATKEEHDSRNVEHHRRLLAWKTRDTSYSETACSTCGALAPMTIVTLCNNCWQLTIAFNALANDTIRARRWLADKLIEVERRDKNKPVT